MKASFVIYSSSWASRAPVTVEGDLLALGAGKFSLIYYK